MTLVEIAACFCCAFVRFAKAVLTAALFFLVGFLAALAFADFNAFGKKSLTEIQELVKSKGLSFGMNLSKFKLDEE